jgi:hypothetical protein
MAAPPTVRAQGPLGFVNPEGYAAFILFPHLSSLPLLTIRIDFNDEDFDWYPSSFNCEQEGGHLPPYRGIIARETILHDHTCTSPQDGGFDCQRGANTRVAPLQTWDIYVYVYAFDEVAAADIAFQWDPTWTFLDWHDGCLTRPMSVERPSASSPRLAVTFDCEDDGGLLCVGWLTMIPGAEPLVVVEHPNNGTKILSCNSVGTNLLATSGSIGVLARGRDGCILGGTTIFLGDMIQEFIRQ